MSPKPLNSALLHILMCQLALDMLKTSANAFTTAVKSQARVSSSVDKSVNGTSSPATAVEPGIAVRMGPVDDMEVDSKPKTNGDINGKRKGRASRPSYNEASGSESDDVPLVSRLYFAAQTEHNTDQRHRTRRGRHRPPRR